MSCIFQFERHLVKFDWFWLRNVNLTSKLHAGYMVINYMVKWTTWSILGWYRFSYTENYWIFGQIYVNVWRTNMHLPYIWHAV